MDFRSLGTVVIIIGLGLALLGLLIRLGLFSWWGKLPGDLSYRGEHVRVFFPIASMLIISLALSLLLYLLRRFF
jgi:hypothetical protein